MKNAIKFHLIIIGVLIATSFIYFLPSYNGKSNSMEDVRQSQLTMLEAREYHEKEGLTPGWTTLIFGGMPTDLIYNGESPSFLKVFNYKNGISSYPISNLLMCFIGFYILLLCFGVKGYWLLFGSLAYGFMTFTMSSIEASHVNKVWVMGLLPAVIGGFILLAKEKYLAGFVVFTYHFALTVYYFHYQISYYSAMMLLVLGLFFGIRFLMQKKFKQLAMVVSLSVIGILLAVGANLQKLKTTQEYTKATMRGGSALATENGSGQEASSEGLDKEYAFRWSYGIGETMTILIPGAYGGSNQESVKESSALYKMFNSPQVLEQKWPLYHGDMPMTSGPVYFGAIIMFLFVLSFFIVKNEMKYPMAIITILSIMLAWGRNFEALNYFLFDNLPFYNKFRTPMMAFTMAQVSVLILAIMALIEIFQKGVDKIHLKESLKKSGYIVGGLILVFLLFGPSFMDFRGSSDQQYAEMIAKGNQSGQIQFIEALKETRVSLMRSDAMRSLFFIAVAFGLLWFFNQGKVKKEYAVWGIGLFMVFDLMNVDWRYLGWKDFKYDRKEIDEITKEPHDEQILQDADIHYRVMDMSRDPFNSNDAAYFHKLVGGYHAAKLSRYQDLISEYIVPQQTREFALDMLNCKYLIGANQQTGQKMMMPRPDALGNAWFVSDLFTTVSAREEMDTLKKINPEYQAVIDLSFPANKNLRISEDISLADSNAFIQLASYHPDTLRYDYESKFQRFVVFSEVYYQHWKLYLDGEEIPLYKVNYTLRGAILPPGKGKLEMIYPYKPSEVMKTETKIASALVMLMTFGWAGWSLLGLWRKEKEDS
jgi:hypothetical protein